MKGTDIRITANWLGVSTKIETSNLALSERKEWVKKLSSLICEIKDANSREVEEKK